jgi:outer membrane immunogenic protein
MKSFLLATATLVVLASPAFAADMQPWVGKAPPGAHNWSGLYLGANCGGAWGSTRTAGNVGAFDDNPKADVYDLGSGGWTCGGQLGFNMQMGGWFWGTEADFGYLGLKKSIYQRGTPKNFVEVKFGAYGVAAARAGVVLDRALIYGKAGVAFASIKNTGGDLENNGTIDTSDVTDLDKTRIGWAAGSGIEYGLSSSWSVKLEYLYMGFGKNSSSNLDHDTFTHRNSVQIVKAGLNWRFGGGPAIAMAYE